MNSEKHYQNVHSTRVELKEDGSIVISSTSSKGMHFQYFHPPEGGRQVFELHKKGLVIWDVIPDVNTEGE